MIQENKWRLQVELRYRRGAYQARASLSTLLVLFSLITAVSPRQAFGHAASLFRQSNHQSRDTVSRSSNENDVRALETGKPIRRELAGGQEHAYRIDLAANQFLKALVEQHGIDVVVKVSAPDRKQILEFNSESRSQGREEVSLVAEAAGSFQLIVRPRQNVTPTGSYEIRIEELRVATNTERDLHEARKQFNEAIKLQDAGKYNEALRVAERALEIRERLLGPEHRDVAAAIDCLAGIYTGRGDYDKAEPLYLRAVAIREKVMGKDDPDTAISVNNLAELYYYRGKYVEAESLFNRALDIREKALGDDHPDTALSLNNLAALYDLLGRDVEAEPLFKRALATREKALGENHPDTAQTLNNLATLYTSQGKYVEAEPLLKRALDIRERTLGENHPETATGFDNLAGLYRKQGKYDEAEPLLRRALESREKALGKNHPDIAISLGNLAALYKAQGKYGETEPLLRRAIDIRVKTLGVDHSDTATSFNNLALLYYTQGKYDEAEPLYRRAIEIYERALGKNHPDTGGAVGNLAALYKMQGKYADAELLYKRARDIFEKALGKDHPDTASSFDNLAALYMAKGELAQAIKYQSLANAAGERNIIRNLVTGSERDKLAYLATISKQTDRTITLNIRYAPDDSAARNLAATQILQRKGRALDATSQNLNSLRKRFNNEDQALLDRLTETRSQIARLVLSGPQELTAEQHEARIKELEAQANKDEADISRRSDEFRAQFAPVTLEAVRAAIPADSALIEFATYRPFDAKFTKVDKTYGQPRYVAYVLSHDGEIGQIDLGEAKAIDPAIASLRKALRDPKRVDVKELARAVDEKVFQPIRPLLGAKSRLLISPDGSLNLIPFAPLLDERGRYAVELYSISYLTSGRDLLRLQVARESKNGPLIVTAPNFGKRQVEASGSKKAEKEPSEVEVKEDLARSAIGEFYFSPLPYAEREGEALQALLPGATLLTKDQASKSALNQIHGPKLLHIATHGFFLEDRQFTSAGQRRVRRRAGGRLLARRQFEQRGVRIESPLLRSGLALAGANEHKEDDNGILTALEVTGLNLWGTKLVTLSACDTGVGEVKNGDGVHGLRRALVLAGAETQVISLWAVSDKATRGLMVAYYERLKQGEGRGEALRQSQLEMLKNSPRKHPYYWASFIQSGEWANLDGNRPE
jgi:CHAT domain-containing protein/Tfp pilus assembly protein PilF